MTLSNELTTQFAKITKDKKNTNSETTVYGTIVESNGLKYVQIDGSEIYTPIASTTNVKDSERVTVMIKNHIAIVTGNITSPAARTAEVDETKEELKEEIKNLVSNVDVEYRLSDSMTEITGDYKWSTSAPELLPNTYIWTRTKTVYADPEREPDYSAARCITGDTAEGRGIVSIIEQYYQSTSTTELIGGTWVDSYPGWESGKYTWTRSVITYTSGEPIQEITDPVCVSGEKGDGISTVINYYLATSLSTGITKDTEGWTEDVQSVTADKKYLWNYEVIIYTNNETISTDPCIIGTYGEDGKGISSITEYYGRSTSSSSQPSSWSETIPTITSDYKYLWNLEIIEYTNGDEDQNGPCVIGVYGDTGDNGRSVVSVTSQWCASTSSSVAPTTGWSDVIPDFSEDQYLWIRTKVIYDDGSVTYSNGVLDTSMEEARKVKAEMIILNDQIVTKITKGDDETLIRQTEQGVIVGKTGGEAQARVSAYGSFDVLVGGVVTTSLGNRRQTIGSLTIFETTDGGTAFI